MSYTSKAFAKKWLWGTSSGEINATPFFILTGAELGYILAGEENEGEKDDIHFLFLLPKCLCFNLLLPCLSNKSLLVLGFP